MAGEKTLRVFISSPGDVRPERLIAARVIRNLDREFQHYCRIESVLWERQPLAATRNFQDGIDPPPSRSDIVLVIVWSRLGTPLPETRYRGAKTGKAPVTGTEWEFEDAFAAAELSGGAPHLMVYRKTAPVLTQLGGDTEEEQRGQKAMVDGFVARWFSTTADGTLASHAFREPAEFEEMLATQLRARILDTLGDVDIPRRRYFGSPFRGLESFEPEHAQIFFGRTRARHELREAVAAGLGDQRPFLLVMGASGSGKSSLVKAGLLPDLLQPTMLPGVGLTRWAIFRPSDRGNNPCLSLATAIAAPKALPAIAMGVDAMAAAGPAELARAVADALADQAQIEDLAAPWRPALILVADQLEEIFSETVAEAERARFIDQVGALVTAGGAIVVATMRSDFFDRLDEVPGLVVLTEGRGRVLLLPPNDAEIGQIITEPAKEAGLSFETRPVSRLASGGMDPDGGVRLDDELRRAATAQPGALPLLEFTLEQLWHRRTEAGDLTWDAYKALGRLEGAIGCKAEEVLERQSAEVRAALPRVLFALTRVEQGENGRTMARPVPPASFAGHGPDLALVNALSAADARLVVAGEDGVLRLAHEALLTHWPRAREIVEQSRADLQLRDRLHQVAAEWAAESGRQRTGFLLRQPVLGQARDLVARRGGELDGGIVALVAESERYDRRQLRRLRAAVAAFALLALSATAAAFVANEQAHEARVQRESAENQLMASLSAQAMLQLGKREWVPAKKSFMKAIRIAQGRGVHPLPSLLGFQTANASVQEPYLSLDAGNPVTALAVSKDQALLAVGDAAGTIRLVERRTGARQWMTAPLGGKVAAVGFLGAGSDMVALLQDGTLVGLGGKSGAALFRKTLGDSPVGVAHWDAATRRMLWMAKDRPALLIFDTAENKLRQLTLPKRYHAVRQLGPDTLLLGSTDGALVVEDDSVTANLSSTENHALMFAFQVTAMAAGPDGRVAVGTSDGVLEIWSLATRKLVRSRRLKLAAITSVAFVGTGASQSILVGDGNGDVTLIRSSDEVRDLYIHDGPVTMVTGLADGTGLAAGWDGRVVGLDLGGNRPPMARMLDAGLSPTFGIAPGGGLLLATGILERDIVFFDPVTGMRLGKIAFETEVSHASFLADGKMLVVEDNGRVLIADAATGQPERVIRDDRNRFSYFSMSRNSRWFAAVGEDHNVFLHDLTRGENFTLRYAGAQAIAVSDDGTVALVATGGLAMWDPARARDKALWSRESDGGGNVFSLAVSVDGAFIAAGHDNGMLSLWDARTGRMQKTWRGHDSTVRGMAVSDDGKYLISGGFEGTVRIWDASTAEQMFSESGIKPIQSITVRDGVVAVGVMGDSSVYGEYDGVVWDSGRIADYIRTQEKLNVAVAGPMAPGSDLLQHWYGLRSNWKEADALGEGDTGGRDHLAKAIARGNRPEAEQAVGRLKAGARTKAEALALHWWGQYVQGMEDTDAALKEWQRLLDQNR
ncbi:hypothetical protein A6A04_20630 [Paramagnetospirillum marisnigri]|uniref:Novel STAND NTPase 1 domain-containing protein n=1 Tax=Paramagnetospirillum marisnigri TaxID=1285242 RepID=A0A178MCS5_9PROT|nr:PQQ-binding-like beta-propeller repeat protein [Paramagnetospirillum marisnigri]OAN46353.1 hypothetical protein A6A04_20630 [Paramagnetospirillum marisnigri]